MQLESITRFEWNIG